MTDIKIRRATKDDVNDLSTLAMRSKAYWGYSKEYMDEFKHELTIKPEWIEKNPTFIAESRGTMVGFAGLTSTDKPDTGEVYFLFIAPECIGFGYGSDLWKRCLEESKKLGWTSLMIHSDPNAEEFYLKMGAVKIGEKPYPSIPGRVSPLLKFEMSQ